jgi:hypothetical protein
MITHLGWLCGTGVALPLLRQHVAAIPDSLNAPVLVTGPVI